MALNLANAAGMTDTILSWAGFHSHDGVAWISRTDITERRRQRADYSEDIEVRNLGDGTFSVTLHPQIGKRRTQNIIQVLGESVNK